MICVICVSGRALEKSYFRLTAAPVRTPRCHIMCDMCEWPASGEELLPPNRGTSEHPPGRGFARTHAADFPPLPLPLLHTFSPLPSLPLPFLAAPPLITCLPSLPPSPLPLSQDPSAVRPEPVLRRALSRLVSMMREGSANWFYACDQLKGMRQDCTVQVEGGGEGRALGGTAVPTGSTPAGRGRSIHPSGDPSDGLLTPSLPLNYLLLSPPSPEAAHPPCCRGVRGAWSSRSRVR